MIRRILYPLYYYNIHKVPYRSVIQKQGYVRCISTSKGKSSRSRNSISTDVSGRLASIQGSHLRTNAHLYRRIFPKSYAPRNLAQIEVIVKELKFRKKTQPNFFIIDNFNSPMKMIAVLYMHTVHSSSNYTLKESNNAPP